MTETTSPEPQRTGMRTGAKIAIIIGIAALVLLIVAAIVSAARFGTGRASIDASESVDAGTSVEVGIPNGEIVLLPADDDTVTVDVQGRYLFGKPEVTVETVGDVTRIDGGCPTIMPFSFGCSVTVTISVPNELPVTVVGTNGAVTATGLTGDLEVGTTNGSITVDGSAGALELRTTNGAIEVRDAESETVVAATTNGEISLEFASSPTSVEAAGTNGSIAIEVPDARQEYAIDVDTVNGDTDLVRVVNDPGAERTILAHTINGSVTITAR